MYVGSDVAHDEKCFPWFKHHALEQHWCARNGIPARLAILQRKTSKKFGCINIVRGREGGERDINMCATQFIVKHSSRLLMRAWMPRFGKSKGSSGI